MSERNERKAEPFEVRITTENTVEIVQESGPEEAIIIISPDQVELLVEWLRSARDEIRHPA